MIKKNRKRVAVVHKRNEASVKNINKRKRRCSWFSTGNGTCATAEGLRDEGRRGNR